MIVPFSRKYKKNGLTAAAEFVFPRSPKEQDAKRGAAGRLLPLFMGKEVEEKRKYLYFHQGEKRRKRKEEKKK